MPQRVGNLRMQPSGRWAVCRPGHEPVEITWGEVFRIEVADGALEVRRMQYAPGRRYYVLDGPELRDGLRAAIGSRE
jgi:hypothetical protein